MFEGIGSFRNVGSLNTYLQQKKLRFAANYKMKTGQRLSDAVKAMNSGVVDSMMAAGRKAEDEASKQRVSLIRQKLLSGKRVSQAEIEYLRQKDPSLYKKAKKAEEYRDELKAKLKNCKTKQEAMMAVAQSMAKAAAEIGTELAAAKAMAGGGGGAASATSFAEPGGGGAAPAPGLLGAQAGGDAAAGAGDAALTEASAGAESGTASMQAAGGSEAQADPKAIAGANGTTADTGAREAGTEERAPEAAEHGKANPASPLQAAAEAMRADMAPDSILEKYLMIVAAIQDEWMAFAVSEDYKALPDDTIEAMREKKEGRKEKRHRFKVEAPTKPVVNMLNAYKETQIHMKEFEMEMGKQEKEESLDGKK